MESIQQITQQNAQQNAQLLINKGTGAGGSNTNKNGLSFEDETELTSEFTKIELDMLSRDKKIFIEASKGKLHKIMKSRNEINMDILPAAGCKKPDDSFINIKNSAIFIIEKKYQQGPGSVDEKIQTGPFKKQHYEELFPNYTIHYIYCLSNWFKRDEYKSVMNYLKKNNISIFWGEEPNYKNDMIQYILNNSL
jgi:hypothetical protein